MLEKVEKWEDWKSGNIVLIWKTNLNGGELLGTFIWVAFWRKLYVCIALYHLSFKNIFHHVSSVQFSRSVMSDSLLPHGLQQARLPCPPSTPGAYSNSCPLSWWCHPTISFSVIPFSSCLQSFPASVSFPLSQFFTSGGQSIGVSASTSVLPMNIQDWFF